MNFSVKTLAATLSVAAFTFAAPQAFADSVNLTNTSTLGSAAEMVMRTPSGAFEKMYPTGYNEQVNSSTSSLFTAGQNLITWCLSVALHKGTTGDYKVKEVTGQVAPSWVSSLEQLFTRFSSFATGGVGAAAMQMAIWEIVGDTAGSYNLTDGDFQANALTGDANSTAAFNLAKGWLDTLNTSPAVWNHFRIVTLSYEGDPKKQDLVTFIPTPLPGAALMFLSALGLGGLARRKLSGGAEPTAA